MILLEVIFFVAASYAVFRWGRNQAGAKKMVLGYVLPGLMLEYVVLSLFFLPPTLPAARSSSGLAVGGCAPVPLDLSPMAYRMEKRYEEACTTASFPVEGYSVNFNAVKSGWLGDLHVKLRPGIKDDVARYVPQPQRLEARLFDEVGDLMAEAIPGKGFVGAGKLSGLVPYLVKGKGYTLQMKAHDVEVTSWCVDDRQAFLFRIESRLLCYADSDCVPRLGEGARCQYPGNGFSYCSKGEGAQVVFDKPNADRIAASLPETMLRPLYPQRPFGSLLDAWTGPRQLPEESGFYRVISSDDLQWPY